MFPRIIRSITVQTFGFQLFDNSLPSTHLSPFRCQIRVACWVFHKPLNWYAERFWPLILIWHFSSDTLLCTLHIDTMNMIRDTNKFVHLWLKVSFEYLMMMNEKENGNNIRFLSVSFILAQRTLSFHHIIIIQMKPLIWPCSQSALECGPHALVIVMHFQLVFDTQLWA